MRDYLSATVLLLLLLAPCSLWAQGSKPLNTIQPRVWEQKNNEPHGDEVVVMVAVVPTYPLTAIHSHTSGEAVIQVKIDSEGLVTSTKEISGSPLLLGGAKSTARRWKFAPATKGETVRTVRLTFVYHLAPRDASDEDLVAVFKPPHQVEIHSHLAR